VNTKEINIETTTLCDAKCIMCPRDEYQFKFKSMNFDLFKKILDDAVSNGAISLIMSGYGDIFMDKNVEQKLKYAKDTFPFLKIFTSTTCNQLTQDKIHLLDYIDTLKISMYGMSKEVYEKVHGGSVKFDRVWENLHNILDYKKPNGGGLYVAMNFVMLNENEHEAKSWKAYWESKVDELQIWKPHNYGGIIENEFSRIDNGGYKTCGRPFSGEPYVHESGEVSVCCIDNDRKLLIGDLTTQKLAEVLDSKRLKEIRKIHSDGSFMTSELICKNCDQITDRSYALLYSSNSNRKVGVMMGHPDMLHNLLEDGIINL